MADPRSEVRIMVVTMLKHAQSIAEKHPDAGVNTDDFNAVLEQAKKAFPGAVGIQAIQPFKAGTNYGNFAARLAALSGAIVAHTPIVGPS